MTPLSPSSNTQPRAIGWLAPASYYCRKCAPEGLREFHPPMVEGDDQGVPFSCDCCGERLAPCDHEWDDWRPWFKGGEFRSCVRPGCQEIDRR